MPTLSSPPGGSVNQIEPSDLTTISFGLLSFFPSQRSASTLREPFFSKRNTVRPPQPATISRFSRSRQVPFALADGRRIAFGLPPGFHFQIVSPMISV